MCTCRCVWPPHGVSSYPCLASPCPAHPSQPCCVTLELGPPCVLLCRLAQCLALSLEGTGGTPQEGGACPAGSSVLAFPGFHSVPAKPMVGVEALSDSLQEFSDTQVLSSWWEGFLLSFLAFVQLPGGLPPSCPRESFWVSLTGTPAPGFLPSGLGLLHLGQLHHLAHHSPTQVRAASQLMWGSEVLTGIQTQRL